MPDTNLQALAEPFPPTDIEWRIGRAGEKNGKIWATCLAYVTNRAIMERLDATVGPANWQNKFRPWEIGSPGVMCGLSIRVGDQWVTKWDGAEQPPDRGGQSMAVKGGFSGAMKRAAVLWGIGRYLYDLPEGFATISDEGRFYQSASKKGNEVKVPAFRWSPPDLPKWALPGAK